MTKFLNLSNDSTFENSSPYIAPTQKAVKEALDLKADKLTTYTKDEVDALIEDIPSGGGSVTPQDLEPKVNRDELADVALSGSYTDLANKPIIPTTVSELSDSNNYVLNSSLSNIATSGSWNDLSNTPTTIANYGITDAYTKTEIDGKLTSSMHFKGTVANYEALSNITNPSVGDMYNALDTGSNYAYDGTNWDKLSENIDLSNYVTTDGIEAIVGAIVEDEGLITINDIPTNVSSFTNDAGYLTQHQDISGKADKATTYTKAEVDALIEDIPGGGSGGVTREEMEEAIEDFITLDNIQAGNYVTVTPDGQGNIVIDSIYSGGSQVDLSNYYTKAEANKAFGIKASEHTHANKSTILDLFSLDGGVLKWNGNPIPINPTSVEETMDGTYDNQEIFNTGTICIENDIKVISQSIVYMTNPMPPTQNLEEGEEDPNTTYLYVYNNDYLLDTIILPPTSTQGYELPIIKTIKIKATGRVSSQLIISGYCY